MTIWYKGYFYSHTIDEIIDIFNTTDTERIKTTLKTIDGHFGLVIQTKFFTFCVVDRIRSIPLFYISKNNTVYIDSCGTNLSSFVKLTKQDIDEDQSLCFEMSGYTVGNKTLYKCLYGLNAGEWLIIKNNSIEKGLYHRYEPWNVINKDYDEYLAKLSRVTLNILKKVIKDASGRQIVIPLSAGNDSRLIASGLKHLGYNNILCYSYGTKGNFESKIAEIIANKLGYKFIFIAMTHYSEKKYYRSKEFEEFLNFSNTYSAIQYIQSISTIKYLKENHLISDDAIFINGNTGDFISGGHILGEVQSDNSKLSNQEKLEIVIDQIIYKHFSLWGYLKSKENIKKVKKVLRKELNEESLIMDSNEKVHGLYEYIEFINRQCKYVNMAQRVYEFYGYEWRLPLWDKEYLEFWEQVPKEYKINQKLYIDMLKENNWANVWGRDIPINKKTIVPKWIIPLRFIAKVPFIIFGSKSREYWHQFEISFFHYWMDVTHMINVVSYKQMIFDLFKKPRHAVSWMVKNYLNKVKIKESK